MQPALADSRERSNENGDRDSLAELVLHDRRMFLSLHCRHGCQGLAVNVSCLVELRANDSPDFADQSLIDRKTVGRAIGLCRLPSSGWIPL